MLGSAQYVKLLEKKRDPIYGRMSTKLLSDTWKSVIGNRCLDAPQQRRQNVLNDIFGNSVTQPSRVTCCPRLISFNATVPHVDEKIITE